MILAQPFLVCGIACMVVVVPYAHGQEAARVPESDGLRGAKERYLTVFAEARAGYLMAIDEARDALNKPAAKRRYGLPKRIELDEDLQRDRKSFQAVGLPPKSLSLRKPYATFTGAVADARRECQLAYDKAAKAVGDDLAAAKVLLEDKQQFFDRWPTDIPNADQAPWTTLFNGRDREGWGTPGGSQVTRFHVENGVLTGEQPR